MSDYSPIECIVAGRLSTLPPFTTEHPAECLPYARAALEVLCQGNEFDYLVETVEQGQAWVNAAAQFCRDVEYWRERSRAAEQRLADLADRECWYCVDCGAHITAPHPQVAPYHYMCPVVTARQNAEYARPRTPPPEIIPVRETL